MANEFKIRKGLIVEGASGGTVVDVQGSQGQLFSVTDDLSGSIFAVSDISGVPILDVNSNGGSVFTGLVSGITPVAADNFVTKAYVDGTGGGTGPFLPLSGGTMTGNIKGGNAVKLLLGANDVFQLYNDGNGFLRNYTGNLYIDQNTDNGLITFRNDNGTGGIGNYFVLDGNTTHAYFSNPGNVGIGTTSPQQKLHIVDTDGANIILNSNTGAENNGVWMTEGGIVTPYVNGAYVHYDSTNNEFKINTGAASLATRFTIARDTGAIKFNSYGAGTLVSDASGNITVSSGGGAGGPYLPLSAGSGSPLTGRLDLTSAGGTGIRIVTGDTSEGYLIFGDAADNSMGGIAYNNNTNTLSIDCNNSERITILSNGNVGIGTTSPAGKLTIADSAFTTAYNSIKGLFFDNSNITSGAENFGAGIEFGKLGSGGNLYKKAAIIPVQSEADSDQMGISFFVANTASQASPVIEAMRVDYGGNVGIGTTSPTAKLHVFGGSANTELKVTTNDNYIARLGLYEEKPGVLHGGFIQYRGESGDRLEIGSMNSGTDTVHVSIDDITGNVGIGTPSPSNRLEIVGSNALRIHDGTDQGAILFREDRDDVYIKESNYQLLFGAPGGMVFELDTNSNDNDFLNVTHRGSSRFYINGANGNVGIGTTSPSAKLDIQGTQGQLFSVTDDLSGDIFSVADISGVPIMNVNSDGTSYFDGNVGIGTSSPSQKLEVSGDTILGGKVYINATASIPNRTEQFQVTGRQIITNTGTDGPSLDLGYNSSGAVRLQLGRGRTADGLAYMDFNGEVMPAGSYGFRIMRNSGANAVTMLTQVGTGNLQINATNSADTVFTNTNVGIGTTSPSEKLHVEGDSATTALISTPNNSGVSQLRIAIDSGLQGGINLIADEDNSIAKIVTNNSSRWPLTFVVRGADGTNERMRIGNNGDVGIGTTTPTAPLHIEGGTNSEVLKIEADVNPYIRWVENGTDVGFLQFTGGTAYLSNMSNGSLQFRTNNTTKMLITSGGNVGIGTTNPSQKLTVRSGRIQVENVTTPIYIKAGTAYKSWVHHIGGDDGYIFAPSTADNGETWDWANQTKLGANGVVRAKNFQLSSDERFKNNIKDIKDIKVNAAFKSFEMQSSPGEKRYGVVAQELEKTNPELIETDYKGFKSVKYIDLLIAKIAELEARLEKLEK